MEEEPVLLVMAVTDGLGAAPTAHAQPDQPPHGQKRNVPPFRGGTCGSLYAHRQNCQRIAEPGRWWQSGSHVLNNGRCGRAMRTLARESLRIVACGLSGTTSRAAVLIFSVSVLGVNA